MDPIGAGRRCGEFETLKKNKNPNLQGKQSPRRKHKSNAET